MLLKREIFYLSNYKWSVKIDLTFIQLVIFKQINEKNVIFKRFSLHFF